MTDISKELRQLEEARERATNATFPTADANEDFGRFAKNCPVDFRKLADKLDRYEKALRNLSQLGGGRSEGNFIAQEALRESSDEN